MFAQLRGASSYDPWPFSPHAGYAGCLAAMLGQCLHHTILFRRFWSFYSFTLGSYITHHLSYSAIIILNLSISHTIPGLITFTSTIHTIPCLITITSTINTIPGLITITSTSHTIPCLPDRLFPPNWARDPPSLQFRIYQVYTWTNRFGTARFEGRGQDN